MTLYWRKLRASVSALAKEVAEVAESRARAAAGKIGDAADAGTTELRRSIRSQPVLAMGVAAAAGALIALAVVPRRSHPRSAWDRLPSLEKWSPNVTRSDLYDFADTIQRSVTPRSQRRSRPGNSSAGAHGGRFLAMPTAPRSTAWSISLVAGSRRPRTRRRKRCADPRSTQSQGRPSGRGMNSSQVARHRLKERLAFQSALAASIRSFDDDTKFHQM